MTTLDPSQIASGLNAFLVILGVIGVPILTVIAVKGKRALADITDIFVNANAAAQNGQITPAEAQNIINDVEDIIGLTNTAVVPTPTPAPQPAATVKPTV